MTSIGIQLILDLKWSPSLFKTITNIWGCHFILISKIDLTKLFEALGGFWTVPNIKFSESHMLVQLLQSFKNWVITFSRGLNLWLFILFPKWSGFTVDDYLDYPCSWSPLRVRRSGGWGPDYLDYHCSWSPLRVRRSGGWGPASWRTSPLGCPASVLKKEIGRLR